MIYTIDRDLSHMPTYLSRGDREHDAKLIYFDGWVDAGFENPDINYTDKVPPVIEFVGDLKILEQSDLPYTDQPYLLISRKMLNVLLSVKSFKYRIYPTLIYSYEIEDLVRDSFDGGRTDYQVDNPSLFTDKFIIMQLAETIDVLDEDKIILDSDILKLPGIPELVHTEETIAASKIGIWYLPNSYVKHYEFTRAYSKVVGGCN
jgi:hypothetical protein